eukprot:g2980.t1
MSAEELKDTSEQQDQSEKPKKQNNAPPNLTSFMPSAFSSIVNLAKKTTQETSKTVFSTLGQAADGGKWVVSTVAGEFKQMFDPEDQGRQQTVEELDFETVKANFGLSETDSLNGSFLCQMQQIYNSVENEFSPIIQVSFPLVAYVTSEVLCFIVDYKGSEHPTKLHSTEITNLAMGE